MDRLRGKVILISGGARGQGAAEARLFVAEGARVVLGDVLEPEGRQLASELGDAATFLRQDVTQEGDWKTAVNEAEKLGGLHGLVNNAGIYQPGTLMETDTELFERHTRVNQLGCFLGMRTVAPLMERSGDKQTRLTGIAAGASSDFHRHVPHVGERAGMDAKMALAITLPLPAM